MEYQRASCSNESQSQSPTDSKPDEQMEEELLLHRASRLHELKESLFTKAKSNIDHAQEKDAFYYNRRNANGKVRAYNA